MVVCSLSAVEGEMVVENRPVSIRSFAPLRRPAPSPWRHVRATAPSSAAPRFGQAKGFQIITWTFERSDLRQGASKAGFYYDFDLTGAVIKKDSDLYVALDVLAKEVKIIGIFSDWPATATYYANGMGIR